MSPVQNAHSLIIETRRAVRAKAGASQNGKSDNELGGDFGAQDRRGNNFSVSGRSEKLCHPEPESFVPLRNSTGTAPNAAFVAQLLGQVMPDFAPRPSNASAAYHQGPVPARLCDRRL
jgi:hypothetical protein